MIQRSVNEQGKNYQVVEKVISFRLLKNAPTQGSRNSEECGVLGRTPQQAYPVPDTGKDEGNAADGRFSSSLLLFVNDGSHRSAFESPGDIPFL